MQYVQQNWPMPYGPPPRGDQPAKESRARKSKEPRDEEARSKPIRITVDLTPDDYQLLNRWLALASVKLDQPISKMTLARGIRAMIQASAADLVVTDAVLDIMRQEQA
jgi:hypothetical protein